MKFPILKSCSILIVSAAIVFIGYKNNACSFFYDCDEWHYAFFNPEVIQQPHVESFFVTCHGLHDNNFIYSITDSSMAEWQQYFNNRLELDQLKQLFQLNQNETKQLAQSIKQNTRVNQSLSKLFTQLAATKNTAAIDYFLWAKKTEPLVQAKADYWSYEPTVIDTAVYLHNIADLKALTENTSDVFLKQRYAFQVLRTLFYLDDYQACIAFYNTKFSSIKINNSITARALSYYAGCYYRLKDYATSNYLFSKIYRQHPALKESAFLSFHPWSDSDWNATLAMAKSNTEKETLWHLFGIYADPLKGMQEILKINAKSNFADLLLVRAINILERDKLINNHEGLFENEFYNDESSEIKIFDSSVSFRAFKQDTATDTLIKFVNNQALQNKSAVWINAAAYLNWLQKDNKTA
ncbi:MAG TPA: hypothetical protein PLO59_08880, partial [Bacteroidia bacterium]|nr:hypothetical protein [Bacteroidia bacterium]